MAQSRKSNSNLVSVSDEEWVAAAEVICEEALECLDFLVEKGCDRSFLIACLRAIAWAELPRISKKEIEQAVQDLRTAAEWIRRLEGSDLGYRIRSVAPGVMTNLETGLDGITGAVEQNVSLADRRAARTRDDCVAALVRHVEHHVKLSRDNEVASMVSGAPKIEAALWRKVMGKGSTTRPSTPADRAAVAPPRRRSKYSEQAHAQWRARHGDMLAEKTVFEREWQAKLADPWRAIWGSTQPKRKSGFELYVFEHSSSATEKRLKKT